jgi:hydroxypyruvate isomerase
MNSRRVAIKNLMLGSMSASAFSSFTTETSGTTALKGNINHAVCRWCYSNWSQGAY